MAFTTSELVNSVQGNKRIWVGYVTATNITGTATIPRATYVDAVLGFHAVAGASMSCVNIAPNLNASGVAAAGSIGFSNVVSSTGHKYLLSVLYH